MGSGSRNRPQPDPDLFEYLLVSAPDIDQLAPVAAALLDLVRTRRIQIVDAVVLTRPAGQVTVRTSRPGEHAGLAGLGGSTLGAVLLSRHDVELASLTLEPDETALLLLVEDRWAERLSAAVRRSGANVSAGERIAHDRVLGALGATASGARPGRVDLLARAPGAVPASDQVAQLRQLARLVDQGVLPLERYDVQRRRVLEG